jgi:ABC-type branched-subunit amino acid transport system substrate-binding protein
MRLIAPQLVFHDLRAELFGPSSWNNSLLLREAGASMEQAVVPSDVAMIPEARRQRFEELWERRYPRTPSSPISLKAYMATLRIIDALAPDALNTRQRLTSRLASGLAEGDGSEGDRTSQRLRFVDGGELRALPVGLFPGLAFAAPDPLRPGLEELPDDAEGPGRRP